MSLVALDGPALPPSSGGPARQIVILLHGYGSNGADLLSLAPRWRRALPDALFLAPNAPERCPGAPGGHQWWDLRTLSRADVAAGVARATPVLDAYIDAQLAAHGLGEDKLLLVGFSQGTMMALHAGPRRARQIAGIIAYSGALADAADLAHPGRTRPPILLIHGAADSVVPVSAFHQAQAELARLGFPLECHLTPGLDHGVDDAGIRAGERFALRVLAG
ncbi:MAG: phospholipase [Sphingomonas bacterium]|nr:phospholipase [Sphingomonas bacterium]